MLKMYFPPAQKKIWHHWYFKWGFFALSGSGLPFNRKDTSPLRQKFAKTRSQCQKLRSLNYVLLETAAGRKKGYFLPTASGRFAS